MTFLAPKGMRVTRSNPSLSLFTANSLLSTCGQKK
jgi:hypothetical protein